MNRGDLLKLFKLLKGLNDTIASTVQNAVESISANTAVLKESNGKRQPDPPTRITVEVQIPDAETGRDYAEQARSYRLQLWALRTQVILCVFTAGAFLAAAYYAFIAKQQAATMISALSESRKQTEFADTSAKAATKAAADSDKALDASRRATLVDQRAYVVFEDVALIQAPEPAQQQMIPRPTQLVEWTANKSFSASVRIRNIGKSPASNSLTDVNMDFAEIPDSAHIDAVSELCFAHAKDLRTHIRKSEFAYGIDLAPQQAYMSLSFVYDDTNSRSSRKDVWNTRMLLKADTVARLQRSEVMILVAGIITYRDIFNEPHETQFCVQFPTADPATYRFCDTHNRIG